MSEMTELTNEQLVDKMSFAAEALSRDVHCSEKITTYKAIRAELLRRLSTQGAGPRCQECGASLSFRVHLDKSIAVVCTACHIELKHWQTLHECDLDVLVDFFRAPGDPSQDGNVAKCVNCDDVIVWMHVKTAAICCTGKARIAQPRLAVGEHGSEVKR